VMLCGIDDLLPLQHVPISSSIDRNFISASSKRGCVFNFLNPSSILSCLFVLSVGLFGKLPVVCFDASSLSRLTTRLESPGTSCDVIRVLGVTSKDDVRWDDPDVVVDVVETASSDRNLASAVFTTPGDTVSASLR